ncbi:MAG: hypothetical protein AAB670_01845, partial [Patescibacteria group bacterium]
RNLLNPCLNKVRSAYGAIRIFKEYVSMHTCYILLDTRMSQSTPFLNHLFHHILTVMFRLKNIQSKKRIRLPTPHTKYITVPNLFITETAEHIFIHMNPQIKFMKEL